MVNIAMMKSPFDIDDVAFQPFYDRTISISGSTYRTDLKACVFEENFDDPLSDDSTSTDRRTIAVFIPKAGEGGWNEDKKMPMIGDIVTLAQFGMDHRQCQFAIQTLTDFTDSWRFTAREVEQDIER